MKRLFFSSFILLLISCNNPKLENETKEEKPNIILIMADDMGFSDLGFMGSGIQTPNIDKLANNGLVFNQFYNAGRCCPTRASLITGLYAHNADLGWMTASDFGRPGYRGAISKNSISIAQVLKGVGYSSYVTGKWHVTYENNMVADGDNHNWLIQRGFDKYYGMLSGGGGYFDPTTLIKDNERIAPPKGFYLTEEINNATIEIIEDHFESKKDTPFFFYVAHYAPHRPLHALENDIKKYKGKFSKGWDYFREQRLNKMNDAGLSNSWILSERPKDIPAWDSLSDKEKAMWETRMEVYAAQIDRMDQGVGRIFDLLKEKNELGNTVILFLSDNGGNAEPEGEDFELDTIQDIGGKTFNQSYRRHWANMSNTPFSEYKSSNHEGGISTPLIVHWPEKIKKASFTNQQGHVIDLMPTLMELSGAKYPETVDEYIIKEYQGKSMVSVFKGENFERGPLYFEHRANRAIIDGKWKLVATKGNAPTYRGKWELYNLSVDRAESNNLIDQHPEKVAELDAEWEKWARENKVLPLDGRGWSKKVKADINYSKK
tara:strand:- start:5425 stop:7062 length:1638 start_codon:yes stop_codon:yes gene_type:complete